MLVEIAVGVALLAGGVALGRVKDAKKLAAVEALVARAENSTIAEAKALAAAIKSKL